ncbi:MAG: RagB/SusD family nutrient uptake outer membrane protein, partial [Tannerella sp.]|nr:RagB/SusD family nutrient uptake outer membrane protein [Tannerella sp.]
MKKINISKSLPAAALLLSVFMSCNDTDFLTEKPETFYTVDNAFSTSEQVDQVVLGCYSHVRNMFC